MMRSQQFSREVSIPLDYIKNFMRDEGERSPAEREQGRHHRFGSESAKEEHQCLRDVCRRSVTERTSAKKSAKRR